MRPETSNCSCGTSSDRAAIGPPVRARRVLRFPAAALAAAVLLPMVVAGAQSGDARELREGGIVRGPVDATRLALVFTGHEFAEGADTILDVLARRRVKASFFLTGVFLRSPAHHGIVQRMVREGHYVGAHSDAHLLYAPWTGPKTTLVTREAFASDLERNLDELTRFGVARGAARFFLPPFEWYTAEIADWTRALGLTLICHTTGTRSTADYTEEGTAQFVPSAAILESIKRRAAEDSHGLKGFMLLLHVGAGPGRRDKFHRRFQELVDWLIGEQYDLVRVDTLLGGAAPGPNR